MLYVLLNCSLNKFFLHIKHYEEFELIHDELIAENIDDSDLH